MKNDIIKKLINKELTSEEAENELLNSYNETKKITYLIAKYWGYKNFLREAFGIEEYALVNFIEDFEKWYKD